MGNEIQIPNTWDDSEQWDDGERWQDYSTGILFDFPTSPLTLEFQEMAVEIIDDFCPYPNALWESVAEGNTDPDKPWEQNQGTVLQYLIKLILIPYSSNAKNSAQYMPNMETLEGHVMGIMYPIDQFKPTLKDTVIFQDICLNVKAITAYRPLDEVILYELDLLQ